MRQRFWKFLRSLADRHIEPEPLELTCNFTGNHVTSGEITGIIINGRPYR